MRDCTGSVPRGGRAGRRARRRSRRVKSGASGHRGFFGRETQGTRKKKICRPHVVFLRASKIHPSIWHVKKKKLARPLFHNPYGRTEVMRVLRANLQGFRCWSGTNTALWSACGEKIAIFLIGGRNFRVHFFTEAPHSCRSSSRTPTTVPMIIG